MKMEEKTSCDEDGDVDVDGDSDIDSDPVTMGDSDQEKISSDQEKMKKMKKR
jgi:hypothetical protein